MKKTAIIVAGGTGKRMKTSFPKQFLLLNKIPILMHSINVFANYDKEINIIVVLPKEHIVLWENLCLKHSFRIPHKVIEGGAERFFSVKNAIDSIDNDCLVAIHDGVRPLVSIETIQKTFDLAEIKGNAIPYTNIVESIRFVDNDKNKAVDRNNYKAIQTPQVFISTLIKEAYNQVYSENYTDDASVVESLGKEIFLTEGNTENIKITTPFDLKFAELIVLGK